MAKYRKKPVVVEAEQWFPGKNVEGVIKASEKIHSFRDGMKASYKKEGLLS